MDWHIDIHMYMISCRVVITHPHPPIVTIISFLLFLLLSTLPSSLSQPLPPPASNYSICRQPYKCGDQPDLYYPFSGGRRPSFCGGGGDQYHLTCNEGYEHLYYSSIQMGSQKFEVWNINITAYTMHMVPVAEEGHDVCSPELNIYLSPLFTYNQTVHNITVVSDCLAGVDLSGGHKFTCDSDVHYYVGTKDEVLKQHPGLEKCGRPIQVPAEAVHLPSDTDGVAALKGAFGKGFNVSYTVSQECSRCLASRGACGSNETTQEFTCYCPDGSNHLDCLGENHPRKWEAKLVIGATAAVFGVVLVSMAFYFYQCQKKTHCAIPRIQSQSMSFDPSSKDSEEGGYYFGVSIFTYSELEEATNYFDSSKELGEGGFGIVYFGILRDGRCVAVKRLYENNYKRVEQFRNEIKILTRIRHQNLVSLYGCTSRHSRELLLVYEYISNGTIADHLHGKRAKASTLPWHIRMNIAVETASALAYLHACGIIHRDVKTKNILLDSYFVVKVADFGLSRIILNHVTDISTAPQGTPGYVDPEYYERYRLTDKSDVYSFGVVLIELISSLPAVDITRHSHEINLSSMAINKIHNQALHELMDSNLGFESDYKVRKMISEVAELAYQCLQSSSDKRPSMRQVMDTLKDIQSDDKCKSQPEVMDIST